MSILKRPINYTNLEYELEECLKADVKYQLENDAKLRAIEQNVPTYEDFRQMVIGAHLKPLERNDINEACKVSWNLFADNNKNKNDKISMIKNSSFLLNDKDKNSYKLSKNVDEFYEKWKEIDTVDNKIKFLLDTRYLLPKIFQIEIPEYILREFLEICFNALTIMRDQYLSLIYVIDILTSLTKCNRIQLTITFMTLNDKTLCHQLFVNILHRVKNNNYIDISIINKLARKFQVLI